MNTAPHFSSRSSEWQTPRRLFRQLDYQWHFDVDVCATHDNAMVPKHWTREDDGLAQTWEPMRCWMNPPYGSQVHRWVEKAYNAGIRGATVCALLPSRTDTAWWHTWIEPVLRGRVRGSVTFLRGRLRFGGAKNGAPFPSVIVVFGGPSEVRV